MKQSWSISQVVRPGAQNWPPSRAGRPGLLRRASSADTSADPLVFWLLVGQISCSAAVVPALTQHPVSTLSSWPYHPLCVDSITNTSAGQQIKWGSTHARPRSSTHIHNWAFILRACVHVRVCVCSSGPGFKLP